MSGNPEIKGIVAVEGKAEIAGNAGSLDGIPVEDVGWLRAEEGSGGLTANGG